MTVSPPPGDTDRLAESLAAELARHYDVIEHVEDVDGDPFQGRFRYGCTCGHERGVWSEREAVGRIVQSVAEQRRHVAEVLAALVEQIAARRAAEELDAMAVAFYADARHLVSTGEEAYRHAADDCRAAAAALVAAHPDQGQQR